MLDLLELHRMQLHLAQVDTVDDPEGDGYVTLLRTVIKPETGCEAPSEAGWEQLKSDACRLKWVDDPALTLAVRSASGGSAGGGSAGGSDGTLSLVRAEVMLALADLTLSVLDRPLLSRDNVHDRLDRAEEHGFALALADLLLARFDPAATLDETTFLARLEEVARRAEAALMRDEDSAALLAAMASAVKHTMRTNLYIERRWALTLRLDPAYFDGVLHKLPSSAGLSNRPYGIFFTAGRHFNGYHVRFSDIARGGLRVVLPPSRDTHAAESRRHFNECFRLAWAQQLKNKDIPEGGAKAVCLVYPVPGQDRSRLLHKCVKKFTDALLDLISPRRTLSPLFSEPTSPTSPTGDGGFSALGISVSSYYGEGGPPTIRSPSPDAEADPVVSRGGCEHELLYLGPDENITPQDINWMAARAATRGYAMPSAFISSKPEAGINHKEYGVTSEVHVSHAELACRARTHSSHAQLARAHSSHVRKHALHPSLSPIYHPSYRILTFDHPRLCSSPPPLAPSISGRGSLPARGPQGHRHRPSHPGLHRQAHRWAGRRRGGQHAPHPPPRVRLHCACCGHRRRLWLRGGSRRHTDGRAHSPRRRLATHLGTRCE